MQIVAAALEARVFFYVHDEVEVQPIWAGACHAYFRTGAYPSRNADLFLLTIALKNARCPLIRFIQSDFEFLLVSLWLLACTCPRAGSRALTEDRAEEIG